MHGSQIAAAQSSSFPMGHRQKTEEGGVAKVDLILSLPQLFTTILNKKKKKKELCVCFVNMEKYLTQSSWLSPRWS